MAKFTFRMEAISPWFIGGADPKGTPELRAPSVRGHLRYWLRAFIGAANTTDLHWLWEKESEVFGSTRGGSAVAVRLFGGKPRTGRSPLLPHNEQRPSPTNAILDGYRCELELVMRPGVAELPDGAMQALMIWSLLGGMGKRSRRMFGALRVTSAYDWWYAEPRTAAQWGHTIQQVLTQTVGSVPAGVPAIPSFPTLHPAHSWVVVGTEVYASAQEANIALFHKLLRTSTFRAHEETFGQARGGRRASPLIAQVRRVEDGVIPVLTALRSKPDPRIDWRVMHDFMIEAQSVFSGSTVWGGW